MATRSEGEELIGRPRLADEETLRQLIRNSFDMIVLLDARGIQRFVSESCERILGYTPDELRGIEVIEEMIHPDDRDAARQGFADILANQGHGGTHYRHRHKDGSWVYLEAFGSNHLENPRIGAVVLNVRDVTERKKAEDALRAANLSKDRLFSIIAHDLRSPFNGIVGYAELLGESVRTGSCDDMGAYASAIVESSQRAVDLLGSLLEWARAQTGQLVCRPEPLDLTACVEQAMAPHAEMARQKALSLRHTLSPEMPAYADPHMLGTVLRNLISNGVKFTPAGGAITIAARTDEQAVTLCISDTGVGIPEDLIDSLFDENQRTSTPGTNDEPGTGLGLPLCRRFVEMHGGTISAENIAGGSRFCFSLPYAD